ncbi:TRAP transporter large permease [Chakrabartyella piscis]|uniref:TRAP transporter large permease n=1 Tax=Chakrabartyella piscis TaxID=2918914 RepID=UPI0029589C94|nr:TRAP transporter large permease [Chakrabartyella piscis]
MLAIFLISLFALILIGVPVAISLVGTAVCMMIAQGPMTTLKLAQSFIIGCDSVPLLAIPFFMLAGEIMNEGGISKRIVGFANSLLGHFRGGLGYVGVLASMVFAGISGSAVADTSAVGSVLLPIMDKSGYNKEKSTALICSAGCVGPIIPPSTQMIIYSVIGEVSVVKMFLGGIIPGILIGFGLMGAWFIHTRKMHYPVGVKATIPEVFSAFKSAIWAVLLPVFIIGCIVTGVATATETASLAVAYALIVSLFIYKEMKIQAFPGIMLRACKSTAIMMMVVGAAQVAAYLITTARIPQLLATAILSFTDNIYVFMILINILLILVGCVMDSGPAIMILAPILIPVAGSFGIDPVYLGVVMVCNLCIGLATPPVGNVLYVGVGLGNVKLVDLIKSIWPFLIVMFTTLFIITFIPDLIMYIPRNFG